MSPGYRVTVEEGQEAAEGLVVGVERDPSVGGMTAAVVIGASQVLTQLGP